MIAPDDRFFPASGAIYPGGPSTWHVVDWDQRRLVSVTMDEEQDSEDQALEHLGKYIDDLAPDVYAIHVSPDGKLVSQSNDPKDDETWSVFRPPLEAMNLPKDTPVVSRLDLVEVDRIVGNTDIVTCAKSSDPTQKLVFKYYFLYQHMSFIWHEVGLWARLPSHPNIVPFDKVVVDELEGRLVGFTTPFIPGGTVNDNKDRTFKLKWLKQLMGVVDYLNLDLGVAHQDIAPWNLLVDEATDSILLFDFNFSARIGKGAYSEHQNDVKGVMLTMYEIITRDKTLGPMRYKDRDTSIVEKSSWTKHPEVLLDHPVADFRTALDDWREKRRSGEQINIYTDATNYIDWPPFPDLPMAEEERGKPPDVVKVLVKRFEWKRTALLEQGKPVLNWQRPPQRGGQLDAAT